ncbi:glycosyltransferase family A protein [Cyclobacterium sp. 1_MG-2023]|uniref:glycosyltransferase family A protein n=1 Tax=Cyclobacterium sp. 1_MG-2023 TaxID=3062681 RepID=UPI0026E14BD0|nr:glycosyltransferase family A protein [Cyclobacterium sp. 1_MG-2023]MDO6436231.1 glycosyltransferase family A protein [Cyclobacterium sp. 1_MG-2023]
MQKKSGNHTNELFVTVITCFFNEEKYLTEAIESVLGQKYSNWELILVDDGSKDGSTTIAKSFAKKYSKIKYHDHDGHINKGLSASRNLAVDLAKGEIIAFLDGDDVWLPDFLTTSVYTMLINSSPLYCEATYYWNNWCHSNSKNIIIPVGADQDCIHEPPNLIFTLYPLGTGAAPCMCGILVDKKILQKHGGFEENFKGMYEDQIFLSKFYLNEKVYISSSCNNFYRQRQESMVNTSHQQGTYHGHRYSFLNWLDEYQKSNPGSPKKLGKIISQAQFSLKHPAFHKQLTYLKRYRKRIVKLTNKSGLEIFHQLFKKIQPSSKHRAS